MKKTWELNVIIKVKEYERHNNDVCCSGCIEELDTTITINDFEKTMELKQHIVNEIHKYIEDNGIMVGEIE